MMVRFFIRFWPYSFLFYYFCAIKSNGARVQGSMNGPRGGAGRSDESSEDSESGKTLTGAFWLNSSICTVVVVVGVIII